VNQHSINTSFLTHLLASSEIILGKDVVTHCKLMTGIDAEKERTPLEQTYECLSLMGEYYGPRPLGLALAKNLSPASFNIVGHLIMSSQTLEEALNLVVTYHDYIMECENIAFYIEGDNGYFSWEPSPGNENGRQVFIEFILASIWRFGIWSTGKGQSFEYIELSIKDERNYDALKQFFNCPISFGAPVNRLVFPASWCSLSMLSGNSFVQRLLSIKLDELNNNKAQGKELIGRLRALLQQDSFLREGVISNIAEHLNLSVRSLQRYLKNHSTNFSRELRMARLQKAEALLMSTTKTICEIALEVGYSEQSAFSYAYKQWKGKAPNEDRLVI